MSDLGLQPVRTAVQLTPLRPGPGIDPRSEERAPDDLHSGRLRIELFLFLLLVATFAAILLKDAIVGRRFAISDANIVQFDRSWYADDTVGGKSAIVGVPDDPLRWSCDLRPGFAFPFCGSGISFRKTSNGGDGRDFSRYGKMVLDFDYRGPSTQLKLALKTIDRGHGKIADGNVKPNMLAFNAVQGRSHVVLDLANLSVEPWWTSQQGNVVEQMGGDLKVESIVGVGSRFWFDIMLPLADGSALPAAAEADEPIPARAHRIMFDAVPTGPGMDRLHDLARAGNMRAIRAAAERLIREEARVRPFAEELLTLARSYQSQAILELIEDHKIESVAL
jgi:hypothetical protein